MKQRKLLGALLLSLCFGLPVGLALGPMPEARAAAPAADREVVRREIAPRLYELAYSPRQDAVFVASAGGGSPEAPPRVLRLDPADLSVQKEIVLERGGFGVALDDEGDRLYVGNALDSSVTVVDTAGGKVLGVVQVAEKAVDETGTARYPHLLRELVVDRERQRVYAPGLSARESVLYVIDTGKMALHGVVPGFGAGAAGIAMDRERGLVYVANLQGQILVVDADTLQIVKTLEVEADQLLNLAFDSSSRRLIATDLGSERMDRLRVERAGLTDYRRRGEGHRTVVIDPETGGLLASIATGRSPIAPLVDEARGRVYVTNREEGTVSVLDSKNYSVTKTIPLPVHPNSLALDKASGNVFVSIKNGSGVPRSEQEGVARLSGD